MESPSVLDSISAILTDIKKDNQIYNDFIRSTKSNPII